MKKPRIDFYLILDEKSEALLRVTCRLAEKAYLAGHQIYIAVNSPSLQHQLDETLWTFRDISFVPHCFYGQTRVPQPPVQIGCQQNPHDMSDILINLTLTSLPFYSQFNRVIEIIPADEASKQAGRVLYRQYRADGCELTIHEVQKT